MSTPHLKPALPPAPSNLDRRDMEICQVHAWLRFRDRRDASYVMEFIERHYFVSPQHTYKNILGRKFEHQLNPATASLIYHLVKRNEYYNLYHQEQAL